MSKLWMGIILLFLGVWPHELSADSNEAPPGPQKTEFKSPLLAWWFGEPTPPTKPFELTRDEEQRIDAVLEKWEIATSEIQSFSCRFTRWDYDESFGPKHNEYLISERHGVLKFADQIAASFATIGPSFITAMHMRIRAIRWSTGSPMASRWLISGLK